MNFASQVIKEQFSNRHLILRLASYDIKSSYQMHYLGLLWQFINPISQVLVYWLVFGIGIRGGNPVGETPFFIWLVIGLIPWFFIAPTIIQGSNSVYAKVNMVSKMKFPVSVLPTIIIIKNTFSFIIMLIFLMIILMLNKINPGIYLIQLLYYMFAMYIFLFSVTLLFSTISTVIRDFQVALQSVMRMLFFLTPILWDFTNMSGALQTILKLNPLTYLVIGFRSTFIGDEWFFFDILYTFYFWSITIFILIFGAFFHMKLRSKFVDYL